MNIVLVDCSDRRQVNQFLGLPFRLYKNVKQWVPPLEIEARQMLNCERHPFYRYGEAAFFLALEGNQTVGRLAILDNQRFNTLRDQRTAFFYLFESEDKEEIAIGLFESAFAWARGRGLNKVIGPKGFSFLDGVGLLVRGFEYRPAFGIPYHLPYYSRLVESAGFSTLRDMLSGYIQDEGTPYQFPERFFRVAEKVKERRGLRVVSAKNRSEFKALVPLLKDIFNAVLGGTYANVPLTDEEASKIFRQLVWFSDPQLIKLVMKDDEVVGFFFAYPDISAAVQRTGGRMFPFGWIQLLWEARRTRWVDLTGFGISEAYRGCGGTAMLISEIYKTMIERGYQYLEFVHARAENQEMLRELEFIGLNYYKTHRVYERTL